jgi:hypothetical protein
MSASIEITHAQANALATLADGQGTLAIRQLVHEAERPGPADIYVTPHAASRGFRIAPDGSLSEIGETLPAPD